MGIILSRVRKKKSAIETLEKLENDIKEIEENRSNAQMQHKKITKFFMLFSLGLYVFCGIIFYFQYKSNLQEKLLYLVPLALSPLLLYLLKRIISWYYKQVIHSNQLKLNEMKKEKKKILDEVMDKETYKVAKEILDKYSTDTEPKLIQKGAGIKRADDGLKKRMVSTPPDSRIMTSTMLRDLSMVRPSPPGNLSPQTTRSMPVSGSPRMNFPAPVLPLQRSYVDRVVEYLIGDGPNNRYALICSRCHSHNGMALKEEFEYLGFKCCYCFSYNPARKIKPEAPRLEKFLKGNRESDSDSDHKASEDTSEEEAKGMREKLKFSQSVGEVRTHETSESGEGANDKHDQSSTKPEDGPVQPENPEQTDKAGEPETEKQNCKEALTES